MSVNVDIAKTLKYIKNIRQISPEDIKCEYIKESI